MADQTPRLNGTNRRDFLKTSAFVGAAALGGSGCALAGRDAEAAPFAYDVNDPEHFIHSVCLQCHTACPIKVKLNEGAAVKIDGNPYGIQTLLKPLAYETPLRSAGRVDGKLCPKGQSGLQSHYDPYRITKVLKRAGKRGEDKWETIPFRQAIREIVEGGKLFRHVAGEEDREVPGLKDLFRLRDPDLAARMAEDAKAVAQGTMTVEQFKRAHADHLDVLIDPDHPDFGPTNNQFVFQAGRIEHGRKELSQRWLRDAFGSINWYEHTTICEQSHHIAYQQMSNQYADGAWTGGNTHFKPDIYNAEFIIFFGTGAFEANFGPPMLAELVTDRLVTGDLDMVVVDPRHSKTAAKAWQWVPVVPGTDAALAYGLIRWIIDHEGYDAAFLRHANKAAAEAGGEATWTNAPYLVRIEADGPGALLRAAEVGLGGEHEFVVVQNGRPVAVDPNDTARPVDGDLFHSGTVGGVKVKTAFQLIADYARSKSVAEWAEACGVPAKQVEAVARKFARHGKKATAELYRGAVQHTNGYYNAQAIITLNLLAGNVDWKGGLSSGGGHWHEDGSREGQPFPVENLHPGKLAAFGHRLTREKGRYEESTLFREEGYPARRPWFPHTSNVYQEIIPSAQTGYPYPVKALFLHKGTPVLASPAGDKMIDTLLDTEALPLTFSCDIVIGETSMFCDYIFPDTSIWERWGTPHITPASPIMQSKVRQPTVEPLVETTTVFGEEMPIGMEAIMLAVAEKLGLSGHGPDGFAPGMEYKRPEDFFLKFISNIAAGDNPGDSVPPADEAEMGIFRSAREHLPPAVYDEARWEQATVDAEGRSWWPEVANVLNRGGRYENFSVYRESGDKLPHPFGGLFNLYVENVATSRHPYTGERFAGWAPYEPIKGYDDQAIVDAEFPLRLITYKMITGGQSRTVGNGWLTRVEPENPVLINAATARAMGLEAGDRVRVVSPSNPGGTWDLKNGHIVPMVGRVKPIQGIHPDVIAISWHYGHWAYGANDTEIDGQTIAGEKRRGKGLCPNAAMRVDPVLENVSLQDVIGGSSSFFDTRIQLVKV